MAQIPNLPPLSTTGKLTFRRSKSSSDTHHGPDWFWKLTPDLPELWIRDATALNPAVLAELQAAWLHYQSLGIPGKGDGADWKIKYFRSARRRLEVEYGRLDRATRRAKEVALAAVRGGPFVIRGVDGSLDYGTERIHVGPGPGSREDGLGSREGSL